MSHFKNPTWPEFTRNASVTFGASACGLTAFSCVALTQAPPPQQFLTFDDHGHQSFKVRAAPCLGGRRAASVTSPN